jgi:hypothetical protein
VSDDNVQQTQYVGFISTLEERRIRGDGGLADVPSSAAIEKLNVEVKAMAIQIRDDLDAKGPPSMPFVLSAQCREMDLNAGEPGVYFLLDRDEIVYIGSSVSVSSRVGQHVTERDRAYGKEFNRVLYLNCPAADRLAIEGALIRLFSPRYNGSPPADTGDDDAILAKLRLPERHPLLAPLGKKRQRLKEMREERRVGMERAAANLAAELRRSRGLAR